MLEFLRRHHKTFWIVVTVVVIISFVFWGASTKTGNRGGATPDDTALTIYGRDYSFDEFKRLGRFQELSMRMGMYEFAQTVSTISQRLVTQDRTPLDFASNLLVLRHEMEKYGVRVSDVDARDAFRHLPTFLTKDGQFDAARAEAFQNDIGSYGFNVSDVYDLMRDWLGLQTLQQLVSGNSVVGASLTDKFYAVTYQTIKAVSIPFTLDAFKKSAQVSDDEIKKYYDQKKDTFKSAPMRAVSYVFIEKPKDQDKKTEEEQRKTLNDYGQKVNDFSVASLKDGVKFENVAKDFKLEAHTLPLFAQDSPPDAVKGESALIDDIFHNDSKSHPVSDAIQGKDGYFIYTVTQVQESKQQDLKEVEGKIKDILVAQKSQEDMMKSASDTRKKLEDAMKAGKKFEDAAKEAGLQPQSIPDFTPGEPPKDNPDGTAIAGEAEKTPAGSLTKPLPTESGVILVYVQSKVLYKQADSAQRKQNISRSLDSYTQHDLFRAWFERRRDEAAAVPHFRT